MSALNKFRRSYGGRLFSRGRIIAPILIGGLIQLWAASPIQNQTNIAGSGAADTLYLGVQEAVLLGLQNNSTVTIQRLQPQVMNTYVREQRAAFDPEVSVAAEKSISESQRRVGTRVTPLELHYEDYTTDLAVAENLPTGTAVSVTTGLTGSVSSLYTDQYTGTIGLTVTQSLLKGFGPRANLVNLRKARLDVDISRAELKGVAESVAADIEKGYWNLYLTAQEIEIQQKSLELADQQLAESQERVKVGKLPDLELAAVEAEVAARRGALIDSQSRYEQARLHLVYLLNPQTANIWNSVPQLLDRPFLPADTLDAITVHEEIGLKCRPDLQQARLSLAQGELDIVRTKNGLLPQMDVFISLGTTAYSETFRNSTPDITSPYYAASAGLTFSRPVPNRQASAQLARARFSRDQQILAVNNLEKLVQHDVRSAYTEVRRARQQIEATRVTRELQQKKLSAEVEKFRVGKSTNILVLQTQRDFTASRLDEASAMVAYLDALVSLYQAEGSLLERRGVNALTE
ncbi:MAG: TolC family protein [Candidatus Neomarinimicrobiota bacterium]